MEKYATYDYYKNIETNEIKKITYTGTKNNNEFVKTASHSWVLVKNKKEIDKIESKK